MSFDHLVQQGEHLAGIAEQHGFKDHHAVWDHPSNAALKKARQNPNVLFPGDHVIIPDIEIKEELGSTKNVHTFNLSATKLRLRLVIKNVDDEPLASTPCEFEVLSKIDKLTTDDTGLIEDEIPKQAHTADLTIENTLIPVRIGDLDPPDKDSGVLGRLTNLGYYLGDPDTNDPEEVRSAVEEFQCDHRKQGLKVTGVVDNATRDRLVAVHGC